MSKQIIFTPIFASIFTAGFVAIFIPIIFILLFVVHCHYYFVLYKLYYLSHETINTVYQKPFILTLSGVKERKYVTLNYNIKVLASTLYCIGNYDV